MERKLDNTDVLWLLQEIIESFHTSNGRGLPLGNLTSQLFANTYMNEFDRFVKHRLRAKHYIRYADDFVIFSNDKQLLHNLIPQITAFLRDILHLKLHQDKVLIRTIGSGVDFLGWAHFPDHRVLRGTTRRRIMNRIVNNPAQSTIQSYLGLLQHGNAIKLTQEILELTRTLPIRF